MATFDRESEVKDGLEDYIYELLSEASPLLSVETLKLEAKERVRRAYDHISDQLEAFQKDKESLEINIQNMSREIDSLEDSKKSLENEIENLSEELREIKKKLEESDQLLKTHLPGIFHGRKYGI